MRLWPIALLLIACNAPPKPDAAPDASKDDRASVPAPTPEDMARAGQMIDRWHAAAAAADEEAYFSMFDQGGVFLGTDGKERWTVPQFRAYAHDRFAAGHAWTMRSLHRELVSHGDVAWFDEDLESKSLGPARGSGVLVRDAKGDWKVAQYNLSIPIPNERFAYVRQVIGGADPADEQAAPIPIPTIMRPGAPAICAAARNARARHAPYAAQLENDCNAAGGTD